MTSSRLPGKSLEDVEGEPMLVLLLRRLIGSHEVAEIVVATTTDPEDDLIVETAHALGFRTYRGSRNDVLGRIVGAVADHQGPIVRITGDCPLIDPAVVDAVVALFRRTPGCAYATNIQPRTFPDGLDVEVISADALTESAVTARDPSDREHVTTRIRREPERFPAVSLLRGVNLGELRWTVDTPQDLEFLRRLVARLGSRRHEAPLDEILAAVRAEPSLATFHGRRG